MTSLTLFKTHKVVQKHRQVVIRAKFNINQIKECAIEYAKFVYNFFACRYIVHLQTQLSIKVFQA
jgi:hypothetical protein